MAKGYISGDTEIYDTETTLKELVTNLKKLETDLSTKIKKLEDDAKQPKLTGYYQFVTRKITHSGNRSKVQMLYLFKDELLKMYPTKSGYKRTYKFTSVFNNNHNNGTDIYINNIKFCTLGVWGSTDDSESIATNSDVTNQIEQISYGHVDMEIDDHGSSSFIYAMTILVYDQLL